ncbi:BlaI/MecI/CopY family transcriptional regulator [Natronoglycomyces albus]|uniref:BlaI/MecI/CopY family transcriptional regulator n=1 Tax=Natronoglycomyces albus TaxID=2811108 RepID=A0A895XWS2_9ACTN|nr:BlaI/MecI/CopY family transcriptional regulator [Natronoglycomyces albus]QSB06670.1 BlaI/MecI/CopY family transcriptional regulator [Natronoglycomyces albus]
MATLGELERAVMDVLWNDPTPRTASQLRSALGDRELAATTVHTVLSRLETKGFVRREGEGRGKRYIAASTREEHVAALMHEVLDQAPDREAVLARFVGGSRDDAGLRTLLQRVLGKRPDDRT